jgi:hypothetical protein
MSWVVFEVLLAFGLAVFIVWWTLPRKKKKKAVAPSSGNAVSNVSSASPPAEDSRTPSA